MKKTETIVLRTWLIITLIALPWLVFQEITRSNATKFRVLEAQRINIRESDGTLRLAISNKELQDTGNIDGIPIHEPGKRHAGMIFFNDLGDEMGGLIFGGTSKENTGGSLTFDRWKNDQTIQFLYADSKGRTTTGLFVNDRPNDDTLLKVLQRQKNIAKLASKEKKAAQESLLDDVRSKKIDLGTTRLFSGVKDGVAQIVLYDANGRAKIKISAGPDGVGKIEAFDDGGKRISR